jgi:hypothetical protein
MNQRSKDFRSGFLSAWGCLLLTAVPAAVFCDLIANDRWLSASVAFGAVMAAMLVFGILAFAWDTLFRGIHEPSKGQANGPDDS